MANPTVDLDADYNERSDQWSVPVGADALLLLGQYFDELRSPMEGVVGVRCSTSHPNQFWE